MPGRAARFVTVTVTCGRRGFGSSAAAEGPRAEPGGYGWPHWLWAVLPVVAACLWLASAS
ncbi:MAG: hypothetical protein JXB32_09525 [Deltaproteobacteria bacterium]|nr:hypothetical protein [Deltaproteobacteria bacterium]